MVVADEMGRRGIGGKFIMTEEDRIIKLRGDQRRCVKSPHPTSCCHFWRQIKILAYAYACNCNRKACSMVMVCLSV
eukprot:scaffold17948_cov37-Cyclotella_meneghiniana.AAC.2